MTLVAPGETITFKPHLSPGRYIVWSGTTGGWYLDVEDGAPRELDVRRITRRAPS